MSTTTLTTTTRDKTTTLVGDYTPMGETTYSPPTKVSAGFICPHCGEEVSPSDDAHHAAQIAQMRIQELEAQVQFLSVRATETAEKLADYEDEIRSLQSQAQAINSRESPGKSKTKSLSSSVSSTSSSSAAAECDTSNLPPLPPPPKPLHHTQAQQQHGRLSTFASYFPYRRTAASTTTPPTTSHSQQHHPYSSSPSHDPDTAELQNALTREQSLRQAAESQLSQASTELEELTAQLFSQANEMVATERKARAKLEERVAVLERRDGEKRKRLDRLEKAIERVERVRGLVGSTSSFGVHGA